MCHRHSLHLYHESDNYADLTSPAQAQIFDMHAAVAMLDTLSTLIEHASSEERRELVNMLFRVVWVRGGKHTRRTGETPVRRAVAANNPPNQFRAGNGA
jgi:hypothetical protein